MTRPPAGARPAPGPAEDRSDGPGTAARPVFVDPSGRRQRRVRRLGRLLVIPAAGYVALLLSAVFGGPSVDSPYLPLPVAGDHGDGAVTTRPSAPGTTPGKPSAGHQGAARGAGTPSAHATSGGAPRTGPSPSPTAPGGANSPASASPSATAAPTVTHGKSTATHPVPTHTGRGHG